MYIHPFVAGVLVTVLAGLVCFVVWAFAENKKNNNDKKGE